MTDETDADDEDSYTYEPSVAEQGIRALVRKAAQRGYNNYDIKQAVKEMLRDNRVAAPTEDHFDHAGAAREMAVDFGDRLKRARDRLQNAEDERSGSTGVEIDFDVDAESVRNDGRPIDILVPADEEPEVVAIARKISYNYGGVQVESEYPLVKVGSYAVCTCPDRHYNRRDGGTCYHELAHDFEVGKRESNEANSRAVVEL